MRLLARTGRLLHKAPLNLSIFSTNEIVEASKRLSPESQQTILKALQTIDRSQILSPTSSQLFKHALNSAVPFIGFGFVDNFLMILFGDAIEGRLGLWLGLSTMACAGWGNMVSDGMGCFMGGAIEAFASKLGLPSAKLTPPQLSLPLVRTVSTVAGALGVSIGCIIGMIPLLFFDEKRRSDWESFKRFDAGDGLLDADDLAGAFSDMFGARYVPKEYLVTFIREHDTDGNGKIDFKEFRTLLRNVEKKKHDRIHHDTKAPKTESK